MKINEFVEKYKKLSGVQTLKSLIEPKKYLSFIDKQELVDRVLDQCVEINNGYVQFDEMKKYIVFTLEIIGAYTNLEFNEDFDMAITEYDTLCEIDALNNIIETFDGEYKTVLNILNMRQGYMMQSNSIEAQIAQFLNGLSAKIDVFTNKMADSFESFGFNNADFTASDINKLTDLIKTLGK